MADCYHPLPCQFYSSTWRILHRSVLCCRRSEFCMHTRFFQRCIVATVWMGTCKKRQGQVS
ncbi:hypothetical protein DAI22_04g149450 [Oryza sativa Japonica Group]|nr:hypothetical protein DAI22_04g149450 [Oryza sativa Japonica Group]